MCSGLEVEHSKYSTSLNSAKDLARERIGEALTMSAIMGSGRDVEEEPNGPALSEEVDEEGDDEEEEGREELGDGGSLVVAVAFPVSLMPAASERASWSILVATRTMMVLAREGRVGSLRSWMTFWAKRYERSEGRSE